MARLNMVARSKTTVPLHAHVVVSVPLHETITMAAHRSPDILGKW